MKEYADSKLYWFQHNTKNKTYIFLKSCQVWDDCRITGICKGSVNKFDSLIVMEPFKNDYNFNGSQEKVGRKFCTKYGKESGLSKVTICKTRMRLKDMVM